MVKLGYFIQGLVSIIIAKVKDLANAGGTPDIIRVCSRGWHYLKVVIVWPLSVVLC